jgi:hypothetical protein
MRYIIFLLFLCSCSGTYYVNRAEHFYRKAQQKGVEINQDTVWMETIQVIPEWRHDTLVKVKTFRDTIHVEHTKLVIDCDQKTVYVEQECPGDTIYIKTPVKIEKTINCPPCKKSQWWKWLLIGMGVMLVIQLILKLK